ncbi:MAG: helix-hairpin-helix domain-containing protein [Dechloromonas sp.]|nr:MAG: helix-hairpin-helix domain-containing protein [Dechloromonas sp.]
MLARLLLTLACWVVMTGSVLAQLDINKASPEQLDGLKGIGPAKAQAIVDYRRQHGPFKSVDELQNVPGIGPATLRTFARM